jgi:hypothetical protein
MARQIVKKGLTTSQHAEIDHTGIEGCGGVETFPQSVHDLEDHSSIPGIPDEFNWDIDAATPYQTAHSNTNHSGLPGIPAAETFTQAVHDEENHSGIPGVGSSVNSWSSNNNTVGASSWRKIQIASANAALVTKLAILAINGEATPTMDYDVEIYLDEAETQAAYIARGIDSILYEDLVPWEWSGTGTIYIKVINNTAVAITDLDITINYRR